MEEDTRTQCHKGWVEVDEHDPQCRPIQRNGEDEEGVVDTNTDHTRQGKAL